MTAGDGSRRTRGARARAWLVDGGVLVGIAAIAYVVLAPAHVVDGDNAEMATLGTLGGRAHPSGYPAYILYLRATSWLPGASAAHASAIATALLAVVLVGVLLAACRAWGGGRVGSGVATAMYAASPIVLREHVQAEVFAMNGLVVASVLWLAAKEGPARGAWRAALLGLVAGIGMGDHLTCVLVAPVGIVGVVRAVQECRKLWVIGLALVGLALGLACYAYLAIANGPASHGEVHSVADVWGFFVRDEYGGPGHFAPGDGTVDVAANLLAFAKALGRAYLYLPALAGVLALGAFAVRGNVRGSDVRGSDVRGADGAADSSRTRDSSGAPSGGPDVRGPDGRGPDVRGPDGRGADGAADSSRTRDSSGAPSGGPDVHGPDGRGPDGSGPDGRGPDVRGPDGRGPDVRGPDGRGPDGGGQDGEAAWAWRALAASFIVAGPLLASRFNLPPTGIGLYVDQRFYLLPILLLAPAVAAAIAWLPNARAIAPARATMIACAVFVVLVAIDVPRVRAEHSRAVEAGVENLLRSLPPHAVVVWQSDDVCLVAPYLQLAEHVREDVDVICWPRTALPWYRARFPTIAFDDPPTFQPTPAWADRILASGRPLFTDRNPKDVLATHPSFPYGIAVQIRPADAKLPTPQELIDLNRDLFAKYDLDYATPSDGDDWAAVAQRRYANTWTIIASWLDRGGDRATAKEALGLARQYAPEP